MKRFVARSLGCSLPKGRRVPVWETTLPVFVQRQIINRYQRRGNIHGILNKNFGERCKTSSVYTRNSFVFTRNRKPSDVSNRANVALPSTSKHSLLHRELLLRATVSFTNVVRSGNGYGSIILDLTND